MYIKPLVSVLMTSFNREAYIAESIKSVLTSSYTNFELIIVDDASLDSTVEIAKAYQKQDERIRVFANDVNLGDYVNRNKAASYAKGKYIKYLDSDDIIYPWGLEAMVYCMEQFPEAAYGLLSYGRTVGARYPELIKPIHAFYEFFFHGSMIIAGPSSSIIRKEAFDSINGFSGKKYIGDTEMWLNLSTKFSMVAMPMDLVWWRQHDEQQMKDELSNANIEVQRFELNVSALLCEQCPLSHDQRAIALRNLKNRKARNLISLLIKGKLKRALFLYNSLGLTFSDILCSFKLNKYPSLSIKKVE
jgi:glycosyltransferase involved in cell wall biosynthesis